MTIELDGKTTVESQGHADLVHGLVWLFAVYWAFNIENHSPLKNTMSFVQMHSVEKAIKMPVAVTRIYSMLKAQSCRAVE